jgi:hypothetical protein
MHRPRNEKEEKETDSRRRARERRGDDGVARSRKQRGREKEKRHDAPSTMHRTNMKNEKYESLKGSTMGE